MTSTFFDPTLQALARAYPGLVYLFNPREFRFIYLNPQVETLTGYPSAELLSMNSDQVRGLFHPEDLEFISLSRHRLENHPEDLWQALQYRLLHKDGAWRWLACRETYHLSAENEPPLIFGLAQDVSPDLNTPDGLSDDDIPQQTIHNLEQRVKERTKALQQAEGALRAFMDAIPESAFLIGPDGRILSANSTFARVLEIPVDDLPGRNLYDLLEESSAETMRQYTRQVITSGVPTRFTNLRAARIIDNLVYPVFDGDGQVSGLAVMGFDITERITAEEALAQKARELARSNADLEQFAYVASHDLQEPLRMVSSFTQLLAERYRGKLDEKADQYIRFAVDGAGYMQSLIDDMLSYSRVTTRAKPFRLTDLNLVLEKAKANLRVSIAESNASIIADPLPTLEADENQLIQLFQNLIGNAIKFRSVADPSIEISCRQEHKEWVFSIKDNGIGIDPRYFERIFIIFQRLHAKSSPYPGTGIGLAICKKVVEHHNGQIWVESTVGHGAYFYFSLPIRQPTYNGELTASGESNE